MECVEGLSHTCANCQTNVGLEPLTKGRRANSIILQFRRFYWFPVSLKSYIFPSFLEVIWVTTSLDWLINSAQHKAEGQIFKGAVRQQPPARWPLSSRANRKTGKEMIRSSIHMPSFLSHDRSGGLLFPATAPYWKPPRHSHCDCISAGFTSHGAPGRNLGVFRPSLEFESMANTTKEEHRWLKPKPPAGSHHSAGWRYT